MPRSIWSGTISFGLVSIPVRMVAAVSEHANFSPETLGGGTAKMLLIVDDPAAAVDRAVAAGAAEIYPVDEQHGWLLGRIEDPFGHHWEIGKPLIPWPPQNERLGRL